MLCQVLGWNALIQLFHEIYWAAAGIHSTLQMSKQRHRKMNHMANVTELQSDEAGLAE